MVAHKHKAPHVSPGRSGETGGETTCPSVLRAMLQPWPISDG